MQKDIILIMFSMFTGILLGLASGIFFFSKETSIYAQPSFITEQSKVIENCMQGYDRTLKLLGEANGLLDKLTQ